MLATGTGLAFAAGLGNAFAQEPYPSRPLRLIAPIAPGGLTDSLARLLATGLSARLQQPVVVENRAGGGGVIGTTAAAKQAADGYNLLLVYQGIASVNPVLYNDLPYATLRDFAPVAKVATFPLALVVHSDVKARSVQELVALAKAKPGSLSYASAGNATTAHLTMELFKRQAGLHLVHIPYKGEAPALNDLMGGQVEVAFSSLASVLPHLKSGRLRPLGIASLERSSLAADIPTIHETGLKGFQSEGWYGVLVPTGTPAAVIDRLNRELLAVLADPETKAKMAAQAVVPTPSSPQALRQWIADETERWRKIITEAGIKPD
jgi:tripartite-type tricarboxylate transporter receptor subunit TctC